jgi:hypothetical protein
VQCRSGYIGDERNEKRTNKAIELNAMLASRSAIPRLLVKLLSAAGRQWRGRLHVGGVAGRPPPSACYELSVLSINPGRPLTCRSIAACSYGVLPRLLATVHGKPAPSRRPLCRLGCIGTVPRIVQLSHAICMHVLAAVWYRF